MDNQEFDEALRRQLRSEDLPAEDAEWARLAARLDQHQQQEATVLPVPVAGRRSWYYYFGLPLAAALCLLIGFRYYTDRQPAPVHRQVTGPSVARLPLPALAPVRRPGPTARPLPPVPRVATSFPVDAPARVRMAASLPDVQDTDSVPAVAATLPAAPAITVQAATPYSRYPEETAPARSAGSRPVIGVIGGYNIGQAKYDFTLGMAFRKKLTSRLQLETSIAVVSGRYDTYQEVATLPPGGVGPAVGKSYEPAASQLLYLQAAPALSYELTPHLFAGAGLDAQRLLSAPSDALLLDAYGKERSAQPDWDFGLTGRIDYQLGKKLRAGFQYRNTLHGSSGSGAAVARRNYLLIQLNYAIF